ncbi:DNA (cytosine-5-)-methyltransferase [Anaerovibrio sp.]|uniref:DNA (cytosine-5-)-methyltransferase n=1 Tax=Anaerovibrio sp. TaxID=1872532 RepID=UPI0038908559
MKPIQILELFGGIGSPRIALRNLGIPIKAIDYVEIDQNAVKSYNSIFKNDLDYKKQTVCGWNLKPDILIHGSPCQDFSVAGKQKGADINSGTRSSLMWETINIIRNMGVWKPKIVIWENVKNVRSKHMKHNHEKYLTEMENMGYTNAYELLDARDFGIPQARQRYFTVSCFGKKFDFSAMQKKPMNSVWDYLQPDEEVEDKYTIVSPSMLRCIDPENYDNAPLNKLSIIKNMVFTITTYQDRCPNAGIIKRQNGQYRLLTEKECWRLQGYTDSDFAAALAANPGRKGYKNNVLYKQAGNSIPVPIFEAMFEVLLADIQSA